MAVHEGQLSATLSTQGTAIRVVHDAFDETPPSVHDQLFYVGEVRPIVEYGLTEYLGVELQLPVRIVRTTIVFRDAAGEPLASSEGGELHHRNETLFGLSDPWLSSRFYWHAGGLTLTGRLGVTVPVGRTEQNPFALGRAGLTHQHIQLGTGTFNPLAAVDAAYTVGRFSFRGYAQAQLTLYDNDKGYRAGSRYGAGVLAEARVVGDLRLALGADVLDEQPERWDGVIEQDGNVGRTDVLVGGSVGYRFGDLLVTLGVKVPVYQHFKQVGDHDPGQLTYPAIVSLSAQTSVDLRSSAR